MKTQVPSVIAYTDNFSETKVNRHIRDTISL